MRSVVRAAFTPFCVRFEGSCAWMYLDKLGLVTTAIGILIDPMPLALALPWYRADLVTRATQAEIRAEWMRVKALDTRHYASGFEFETPGGLRLTETGIPSVVDKKLDQVDWQLARRFASYPSWPADAQQGALSIAWAAGAAWAAPKFQTHADATPPDFAGCAAECEVHTRRDPVNRVLFANAAAVVAQGLDPDVLYYPRELELEQLIAGA